MEWKRISRFIVPGVPQVKKRPRARVIGGFARVYTPDETLSYEQEVRGCYLKSIEKMANEVEPTIKPIRMHIVFSFSLTKSDYGKNGINASGRRKLANIQKMTSTKDVDNLSKAVLDGLNRIAFQDDKQVVELVAMKKWSEAPYVMVTIDEYLGDPKDYIAEPRKYTPMEALEEVAEKLTGIDCNDSIATLYDAIMRLYELEGKDKC